MSSLSVDVFQLTDGTDMVVRAGGSASASASASASGMQGLTLLDPETATSTPINEDLVPAASADDPFADPAGVSALPHVTITRQPQPPMMISNTLHWSMEARGRYRHFSAQKT